MRIQKHKEGNPGSTNERKCEELRGLCGVIPWVQDQGLGLNRDLRLLADAGESGEV